VTRTVPGPEPRQLEHPDAGGTTIEAGRRIPIVRLPRTPGDRLAPTWRQADPARIATALAAAERRDPGGWYVVGPSSDVPANRSAVRTVAGREVVFWRTADGRLSAGPGACPHLGAALDDCPVSGSTMRCRWHGLAFTPSGSPDWRPYPAHDDGVLVWVQLSGQGANGGPDAPVPERPPLDRSVAAVIVAQGRCEPRDVIANRLDPWHGSWLHPYAFSHLTVDDAASTDDRLVVDVVFRLGRTYGVPVRAVFFCPDARTVTMLITEGEGAGSVVETHATPIGVDEHGAPITQVTEATIAFSDRSGFRVATRMAALIRPAMRRTARHLWADDLAYAQRRYRVRVGEVGEVG
jgi:nitrite reductase/ring-hydroxylating ferredoxin subunit